MTSTDWALVVYAVATTVGFLYLSLRVASLEIRSPRPGPPGPPGPQGPRGPRGASGFDGLDGRPAFWARR